MRRFLTLFVGVMLSFFNLPLEATVTNLTNNDPEPIYSSLFPQIFLTRNLRDYYIERREEYCPEWLQISFSPFRQSANSGKNLCKERVELGDLTGRWNIPALFYPEQYGTEQQRFAIQNALFNALDAVVPGEVPVSTSLMTTCSDIINPAFNDARHEFGFFSVPIKYRKLGVRFQVDMRLAGALGLRLQTGVADLKQIPCFVDLTCAATGLACPASSGCQPDIPCTADSGSSCADTTACIDLYSAYCKMVMLDQVMKQKQVIADTLGMNIREAQKVGPEDTRVILFLNPVFRVNYGSDEWQFFLCMPYATLDINAPTGKKACPNKIFDLPLGNNGHTGYGGSVGITFDFITTLELGIEGSAMKYNKRTYNNYPVPTDVKQSGIFPRLATVAIDPGLTWNFTLSINAYHFLDKLSGYVQYVFNGKEEDKFCIIGDQLLASNVAFERLSEDSKWESNMVNVGFTYDISPNIALGFLWQSPASRRNAYRSTTVGGSIVATF